MNKLRFQRRLIYRLKRDKGVPLSFYQPVNTSQDLKTGVVSRAVTVTNIRRAIVMQSRQLRDFEYDLSFIAANKNFTMGGYFDQTDRVVLIDAKDLPSGFKLDLNDYVQTGNRRYNVLEGTELEMDDIFVFKIREIKERQKQLIHIVKAQNVLGLTQSTVGQ